MFRGSWFHVHLTLGLIRLFKAHSGICKQLNRVQQNETTWTGRVAEHQDTSLIATEMLLQLEKKKIMT